MECLTSFKEIHVFKKSKSGQALIEYIILLAVVGFISTNAVKKLGSFLAQSSGNLSYVLSVHLSVGVCKENCFFSGYENGQEI